MRKLFQGLTAVDSYVDDTIVHAPTWREHMVALRETLDRIAKAGLTVRPSKCLIGAESLDFIGYDIGKGIIEPDEENIRKVRNAPRPTTKKELRSFIGLAGFYRDFVPNFSAIAVPLTDLAKKDQPNRIQWKEAQEAAYRALKTQSPASQCYIYQTTTNPIRFELMRSKLVLGLFCSKSTITACSRLDIGAKS